MASEQAESIAARPGRSGNAPPAVHRFAPGRSGNPGGRPKFAAVSRALRRVLAGPASVLDDVEPEPGATAADALANALVLQALRGDVAAARLVLDRAEGRVPESVRVDASGSQSLRIVLAEAHAPEFA